MLSFTTSAFSSAWTRSKHSNSTWTIQDVRATCRSLRKTTPNWSCLFQPPILKSDTVSGTGQQLPAVFALKDALIRNPKKGLGDLQMAMSLDMLEDGRLPCLRLRRFPTNRRSHPMFLQISVTRAESSSGSVPSPGPSATGRCDIGTKSWSRPSW